MSADFDGTARAYLLGELPEESINLLELSVLTDRDRLERVERIEQELIDEYLDDRLPAQERAQFERYYLASPVHRDRVALVRDLTRRPVDVGRAPRWTFVWAAAAAAALLLGIGWLGLGPSAPDAPTLPSPRVDADRPSTPATPSAVVAEPSRVTLLLQPIITRGRAETARLVVPPGTTFVELRLQDPKPPQSRPAAEVRSVDERLAWFGTAEVAPAGSSPPHAWVVSVPADRLAPDDYIVTLSDPDGQVLARYFFRLVGQR